VLLEQGTGSSAGSRVDRRALAGIVFADPSALLALEAIVHPLMWVRFADAISEAEEAGRGPVVLDAAILLEAGWQDLCNLVAFVDSPRSERIRRAADNRGWSLAVFDSRERAQWPCEEKRRHADHVIRNDADLDSLRREVEALIALLGEEGKRTETLTRRTSEGIKPPSDPGKRRSGTDAWQSSCFAM
jgi:dephospho-CoA kinase